MTYSFDGNTYIIVLQKGEELLEELRTFVSETNLKAAWLSAIGAALQMEIGYYNLETHDYQWRTFDQTCEIVSLQGNLSQDETGKPAFHLHGVFADESYQTVGGHVNKLVVGGTCEVVLREFGQPLERHFDEATGLRLLSL